MALLKVRCAISGPQAYRLFNPLGELKKSARCLVGEDGNARFEKRTRKITRSDQVGQDAKGKAQQRKRERQGHGGMQEVAEIFVIVENVHRNSPLRCSTVIGGQGIDRIFEGRAA
jgi:hypothetical protein